MGTSKAYDAPTTPQWSALKGQVSRTAGTYGKDEPIPLERARNIVRDFVSLGGGTGLSSGGGTKSTLSSQSKQSRTASRVAARLGSLLADVGAYGLGIALEQRDIIDGLKGLSANDVVLRLCEFFSTDNDGTIDDADAMRALGLLLDELLSASDMEALNKSLSNRLSDPKEILRIIIRYFGFCIFTQFCRVFAERIIERADDGDAKAFQDQIRDCILSDIEHVNANEDLSSFNWAGEEARELADDLFERTRRVWLED